MQVELRSGSSRRDRTPQRAESHRTSSSCADSDDYMATVETSVVPSIHAVYLCAVWMLYIPHSGQTSNRSKVQFFFQISSYTFFVLLIRRKVARNLILKRT
ncbi:hypothetical protein IWX92DRAFT_178568 [Phyllosticta citricarpa]